MAGYEEIPSASTPKLEKFRLSIPEQDLKDFKGLLRIYKLAPKTNENLHPENSNSSVSHARMTATKDDLLNEYDWDAPTFL
ncbi:uncharacterized protein A1O9_02295 [Exophiala aquamarina CBS 119918]|uniref:Uncharacterized protein n=1 Tax=Exophiala aquamarina CBS 119918 TaxID=1182545 RepID=A0A072PKX1_9EURO|nr:uncharacterized protein A1O9_02295 [Exophiala aquamarina CBS 119918]KEF60734.1 hypothetical protein A1O9_02295 [Exophiala aquamarina CBS 119918]